MIWIEVWGDCGDWGNVTYAVLILVLETSDTTIGPVEVEVWTDGTVVKDVATTEVMT